MNLLIYSRHECSEGDNHDPGRATPCSISKPESFPSTRDVLHSCHRLDLSNRSRMPQMPATPCDGCDIGDTPVPQANP